jgi:hypothetical protein
MKDQDLPESENVEDRRDDPPVREPTGVEQVAYNIETSLRQTRDYPDDEDHQGDMADQGGINDIKGGEQGTVGRVMKGALKHVSSLAAGGPVKQQSSLTRLTAHPIFPQVKIVHRPMPALTDSSPDMKTVFINARVPITINVNGKRVPTAAPLSVFELYSRAGCEVFKEAAQKAGHQADEQDVQTCARRDVGEVAEKHFLQEQYDFTPEDWAAYCKIMQQGAGRQINQSATGGG